MEEIPTKKVSNLVDLRQSGILLRLAAGESIASISRDTGMDQRHLYRIASRSHDLIRESIDEAHERIRARLPTLVDKAMDIIEHQMTHGFGDTKLRAARTILSIAARFGDARPKPDDRVINPD